MFVVTWTILKVCGECVHHQFSNRPPCITLFTGRPDQKDRLETLCWVKVVSISSSKGSWCSLYTTLHSRKAPCWACSVRGLSVRSMHSRVTCNLPGCCSFIASDQKVDSSVCISLVLGALTVIGLINRGVTLHWRTYHGRFEIMGSCYALIVHWKWKNCCHCRFPF